MPEEVRYHMLRPAQIVARRKACPIAYLPLGVIEWHGPHMPTGADGLQAEGFAELCARRGGGLAFPCLWYGESRIEALVDSNPQTRDDVNRLMELPPENFTPQRQPFDATEQLLSYHKLLIHMLNQLDTLGFKVGVLVAGHYPLIDHARSALLHFNQRRYGRQMIAWACMDAIMVADKYAVAGDHGGGWETSHVMHLHPQTVDLSTLPPKGQPLVGHGGKLAPQDSTAAFGKEIMEASAEVIVREARDRLDHPERYAGHGKWLLEGLWKAR